MQSDLFIGIFFKFTDFSERKLSINTTSAMSYSVKDCLRFKSEAREPYKWIYPT